jgi:hypothetical protein
VVLSSNGLLAYRNMGREVERRESLAHAWFSNLVVCSIQVTFTRLVELHKAESKIRFGPSEKVPGKKILLSGSIA